MLNWQNGSDRLGVIRLSAWWQLCHPFGFSMARDAEFARGTVQGQHHNTVLDADDGAIAQLVAAGDALDLSIAVADQSTGAVWSDHGAQQGHPGFLQRVFNCCGAQGILRCFGVFAPWDLPCIAARNRCLAIARDMRGGHLTGIFGNEKCSRTPIGGIMLRRSNQA